MKFRLLKASEDWKVEKISETDWVIKSPDGTYKNSDGEDYHFKTKEDALEELDYLRAEHKFEKKSKVGYGAKPETMEEEMAIELGDALMRMSNKAWDYYNINGWSTEEQRQKILKLEEQVVNKWVKKYQGSYDIQDPDVLSLIHDHLEDNNFHTLNEALEKIVG
jgi:hypothetical protein